MPVAWSGLGPLAVRTVFNPHARNTAVSGLLRWARTGAPVIVVASAGLLTASATLMLRGDPTGLWLLLFMPIASALLFVVLRAFAASEGVIGRVGEQCARAALAKRRCPRCDYDLSGQPAGVGVVRCPECSTPWRERDVGLIESPPPEVVVIRDR